MAAASWSIFIQNRTDRKPKPLPDIDGEPPWYIVHEGVRHFRYSLDTLSKTAWYEVDAK